jgi:FixJ family two-component response regulator
VTEQAINAAPVVFVVDDDADMREGLKARWTRSGCGAGSSPRPTNTCNASPPTQRVGLVLDVRLPGLSGLDLQTEMANANIDIPIIFLTGHGDIRMTVKAMKAGAVGFLTKPVREQDLLDAINVRRQDPRLVNEFLTDGAHRSSQEGHAPCQHNATSRLRSPPNR